MPTWFISAHTHSKLSLNYPIYENILVQVYIHIGRPKTGSTALQKYFTKHRKLFVSHGYLYPLAGAYRDAHDVLALSLLKKVPDALEHIPCYHVDRIFNELRNEIARTQPKVLIISSELLSLLTVPNHALACQSLYNLFEGHDVKIVTYYRSQCDSIESGYSQEIKNYNMSRPIHFCDFLELYLKRKTLDYLWSTNQWGHVFGIENVIVRPFERCQLIGENIVDDFSSIVGVSRIVGKGNNKEENIGLTCQRIDMMNRLAILPFSDYARKVISSFIQNCPSLPDESVKYSFIDSRIREQLLEEYKETNREVAEKFVGRTDGVLFKASGVERRAYPGLSDNFLMQLAQIVKKDLECREALLSLDVGTSIDDDKLRFFFSHLSTQRYSKALFTLKNRLYPIFKKVGKV